MSDVTTNSSNDTFDRDDYFYNMLKAIVADGNGNFSFDVLLHNIGQDGEPSPITQGGGMGTREHDDVMLSFGYSHFTRHHRTITGNNFLVIRLDVNGINQHHAEGRLFKTRNESCQVKVYDVTGQEGLFPANPVAMPVFNQKTAEQETPNPSGTPGIDVLGQFFYHDLVAADPFSALTPIDDVPMWIASATPVSTRPDGFPSVKGRYYQQNRTYAVVIENLNGSSTEVYYQYDWHEY